MELLATTFKKYFTLDMLLIFLHIVIFLAVMEAINFAINIISSKIAETTKDIATKKQVNTTKNLLHSVVRSLFAVFIVLYLCAKFGIDLKPYLAAAGLFSVAVGFGARRFFEDIITGLIIFFDKQIRVGDVVEIAGVCGTVEAVTLKCVKLRDLKGHVYFVRNSSINTIKNMTKNFAYCFFDVQVAYKTNINKAYEVLNEIADQTMQKFPHYGLEKLEIMGLDSLRESAMIIRARMKINTTIAQWEVSRAFNKLLKETFDKEGIEIPFPQRTLHILQENL